MPSSPDTGVNSPPLPSGPAPVVVQREPIYLRVPPGHAKKWRKHCHKYNACGERVFFVQESWYHEHYAAGRNADRRDDDHPGKGHGKGHGKGS